MSTFETIYVIGHTIGSFLLLMVQFFVVKNYVVPFAKKIYHGKTELDAAGFIRADENDKRAPA